MKIDNAIITMHSASTRRTASQTTESLRTWGENMSEIEDSFENSKGSGKPFNRNLLEKFKTTGNTVTAASQSVTEVSPIPKEDEFKIRLLNLIFDKLFGKKLKFQVPKDTLTQPIASTTYSMPNASANNLQGWGFDYEKSEYYMEQETMNFNSSGVVKTSDGKELRFNLNLALSHSFTTEHLTSIKAGDALIDPLVINYGRSSAGLTQRKFSFDLDNNGTSDSISFATAGSGFLAYDRNNDGIINNGSELFGPGTGNGFLELSKLDSDGNNWIDENDPIYDKLQIWTKDEEGNDQLFAIGQKGIGAIYLGSAKSNYSLKDSSHLTQGEIRQTGIFLRENGTVGTIQHLDISM